jgi:hypothetical protein
MTTARANYDRCCLTFFGVEGSVQVKLATGGAWRMNDMHGDGSECIEAR